MHAFEVLAGSSFLGALEALLFAAVCASTLFAARMGNRAENVAAAMIAYRFVLFFLLTIGPDSWRKAIATMVAVDVALSIALLVVALRHRRPVIAALGAVVLGAAVVGAMKLGAPRDALLADAGNAVWGLALAVLTGAAVEAMLKRRRFGYPLAPARPVRPLLLRAVRGLCDPRGRLDRRGYLAWTGGLVLAACWLVLAFTCLGVPALVHAKFLGGIGLSKPIAVVFNVATVVVGVSPLLMTWCSIALAVRRLRDCSPRPLLCLAAMFVAGVAEGALGLAPALGAVPLTSVVGPAFLLLWPGRRPAAAAEPAPAGPTGLVPAAA